MPKKNKLVYAKDMKCCKCRKKAVCFWPMIDPDIQHHPYCRKCVTDAQMQVMLEIQKIDEKYNGKS